MQTIERRVERVRSSSNVNFCYCKLGLKRGFVELEGKIVDISSKGIRLQLSYMPDIEDVVRISSTFAFDNYFSEGIEVIVRWCKYVDNASEPFFEVGCEVSNSGLDIYQYFHKFN